MEQEIVKYQEDFTDDENKALASFIKKGCPGLAKIGEVDTFEWFQLYMAGKSYGEIATISNVRKDLVIYMANKLQWHSKRMEYYSDITSNLVQRTQAVKAESAGTIATMVSALNQYFGEKFTNYIKTKDASHLEGVDVKMLSQYYKSLEILDKLMGGAVNNTSPSVNINVSGATTVEKTSDGSVVVTNDNAKDILSLLSQYKKKMASEDDI
jgi:hypothetical protein